MPSPLIGIITYRHPSSYGFSLNALAEAYIQAVSQAGGIPVLIPLGLPEEQLNDMLPRLDGILFSGGGDIEPQRFGADNHPEVKGVDTDRDRVEIQLARDVVRDGIPFLGICRGIQLINVALGGTLYTHLSDQYPGAIQHSFLDEQPRDYLAHEVKVQAGTQLFEILGDPTIKVNSLHHQGIRQLAAGLKMTAQAPDGLIEGVEIPEHPFGIAVQWHPEWLTAHAPMRDLFRAFVEAAVV
ncbi:MAG: gamma-glutamyl-gamma-aminobutyrate hydrolase family protein [Chloroflexi bacterium]|nr:gamma-glutamyl-gamma-aminobutyrate hydrolase family protein [Chloroflexota bacterium]MBU1662671.1 gamma-glutamyl-gamma-aminobutyrate hydrolase family protein [Chloroflexota bacterium]